MPRRNRITFIVGAGASHDLDASFPIGTTLATQIETLLEDELRQIHNPKCGPIASAIMRFGGMDDSHVSAMARIRSGIQSSNSIDDFINEWRDRDHVETIAKLCIANRILVAEERSVLSRLDEKEVDRPPILRGLRESWINTILRYANLPTPRRNILDCLEGMSFVVFNYDRVVEQFLFHAMTSTYDIANDEARVAISSIPIIHVYGSLGQIPMGAPHGIPYGASDQLVANAAATLKTYNESIEDTTSQQIKAIINSSDKLIFLGCGYHHPNMQILADFPIFQNVWGTTLGLQGRTLKRATDMFAASPQATLQPLDCTDLLQHHHEEIFDVP